MATYRLHDPERGIIGPVSLKTVADLVTSGVVHEGVWVSRDNGPFLPATAFSEIKPQLQPASPMGQPTYSGDLGKNTFFKVFFRFHLTRASGLLVVTRDGIRKEIHLEKGEPVFVTSSVPSEHFGEYLVRRGKVERDDLKVALQSMDTDNNRLGDTLIRLGLMEPQEVFQELRGQQIFRLLDLCDWEVGRYQFYEGQRYTGDKIDLQLHVPDLIIQAARRLTLDKLEARLRRYFNAHVERQRENVVPIESLRFTATERRVVDALDGDKTLAQLLRTLGVRGDQRRAVLMVIYLLWEIDGVSFRMAE